MFNRINEFRAQRQRAKAHKATFLKDQVLSTEEFIESLMELGEYDHVSHEYGRCNIHELRREHGIAIAPMLQLS